MIHISKGKTLPMAYLKRSLSGLLLCQRYSETALKATPEPLKRWDGLHTGFARCFVLLCPFLTDLKRSNGYGNISIILQNRECWSIYNVSSGYQYFFHLSEHIIQQNLSCISFSTTLKIHLKRRVVAYQTSLLTLATGVLLS